MLENLELEVRPRIGESGNVYGVHAKRNGKLVGHAYGYFDIDQTAVLESINVDLHERGKGIGSLLLNKFVECMMLEGVKQITGEMKTEYRLHILETKRFYQKHGFDVGDDFSLRRKL